MMLVNQLMVGGVLEPLHCNVHAYLGYRIETLTSLSKAINTHRLKYINLGCNCYERNYQVFLESHVILSNYPLDLQKLGR